MVHDASLRPKRLKNKRLNKHDYQQNNILIPRIPPISKTVNLKKKEET